MDEQELYAKLRERAKNTPEEWGNLMDKASAEIDRLRAENERLRKVLNNINMDGPVTGEDAIQMREWARAALEGGSRE